MKWNATNSNGVITFYTESCIGRIKLEECDDPYDYRLKIGSRNVAKLYHNFPCSVTQLAENWLREQANKLLKLYCFTNGNATTALGTIKVVRIAPYTKIYLNSKCIATAFKDANPFKEVKRVAYQLLKEIES